MWRIFATVAKRLLWSQRNRILRLDDEELRAIARVAVGDGKRPFSLVLAEARERVELAGAKVDDAMDARLVDALDVQLLLVRIPAQLDELVRSTEGAAAAFETKTSVVTAEIVERDGTEEFTKPFQRKEPK